MKEVGFKAVARRMLAGALCCLAVNGSMLAANTPFRTAENVSDIPVSYTHLDVYKRQARQPVRPDS